MCDTSQNLKLCTCKEKIDKSKPYWMLSRKRINQGKTVSLILGSYEPETINESTANLVDWLESQLNNNDCFDFDYHPMQDDKLVIHKNNLKLEFIYSDITQCWNHQGFFDEFSKIKRSVQVKGYLHTYTKP